MSTGIFSTRTVHLAGHEPHYTRRKKTNVTCKQDLIYINCSLQSVTIKKFTDIIDNAAASNPRFMPSNELTNFSESTKRKKLIPIIIYDTQMQCKMNDSASKATITAVVDSNKTKASPSNYI